MNSITLQARQPEEFPYEDGRIGMDVSLTGGFTLDLRAMQLWLVESRTR